MFIYQDTIANALGIRPIQELCLDFDHNYLNIPDDSRKWGPPKGYTQHPEHIKARTANIDYKEVSNKLKGRPSPTTGMKLGPPSEETRKKISESNKGKKKNNSDGKMGQYWVGKEKYTFCCVGCQQSVSPSRILRHEKCFKEYIKE